MNVKRAAGNIFHDRRQAICYDVDSSPVVTGASSLVMHKAAADAKPLGIEIIRDPRRPAVRLMPYEVRLSTGDYADEPVIVYEGTNESEDRYGTVITMAGWKTDAYMQSAVKPGTGEPGGVVMPFHMYDALPIGRTFKLDIKAKRMLFAVRFAVEYYDFAAIAYKMVKDGFMSGCSVGFIPLDAEEYQSQTVTGWYADNTRYLSQELLELSITPVGANRGALANMLQNALAKRTVTEGEVEKFHLDRIYKWHEREPIIIHARNAATLPKPADHSAWFEDKRSAEAIARAATPVTRDDAPAAQPLDNNRYIQSLMTAANLADEVCDLVSDVLMGMGCTVDDSGEMHPPGDGAQMNGLTKAAIRKRAIIAALALETRESKVLSKANEDDLIAALEHLNSINDRHKAASKKADDEATNKAAPTFSLVRMADKIVDNIGRATAGSPSAQTTGDDSSSKTVEGADLGHTIRQLAAKSDDVFSLIFRAAAPQ